MEKNEIHKQNQKQGKEVYIIPIQCDPEGNRKLCLEHKEHSLMALHSLHSSLNKSSPAPSATKQNTDMLETLHGFFQTKVGNFFLSFLH